MKTLAELMPVFNLCRSSLDKLCRKHGLGTLYGTVRVLTDAEVKKLKNLRNSVRKYERRG